MELKWLEDFVTLAETSSFSRAAELRNVTQPAFSRRIKQLEAWLGATLISRATLPAELTPAGRSFLPVAQESIRNFYMVREALRPASEAGLVRIAALHTLTVTLFPGWLAQLEAKAGPIGTSFIADRGGIEANVEAMVDGEADIFLTYSHPEVPFHLDHDKFEYLTIGADRLVPVVAPSLAASILQGKEGIGLIDCASANPRVSLPYLSYGYSSFFGVALGRLFGRRPVFKRRTMHENSISVGLKNVALMGGGLCWLPRSLVSEELASGQLILASQDQAWQLDLGIRLYRHTGNRSKPVETMWRAASGLALNP